MNIVDKLLDKIEKEVMNEIKKDYLKSGEDQSENLLIQVATISADTTKRFIEKYEKEKSTQF